MSWLPHGQQHQLEQPLLVHQRSLLREAPEGGCSSPGLAAEIVMVLFLRLGQGGSVPACSSELVVCLALKKAHIILNWIKHNQQADRRG